VSAWCGRETALSLLVVACTVFAARVYLRRGPPPVPPEAGPEIAGNSSAPVPPHAASRADPACDPGSGGADEDRAVVERAARYDVLLELLEPHAARSRPVFDEAMLRAAAAAVGPAGPTWIDCTASPCVVRYDDAGSPLELLEALRDQPGMTSAHLGSWALDGAVLLSVWPDPPSDAEEAAAGERVSSLYRRIAR
jgi:hypothetical protein